MGPWTALLVAYLIGGVTFIPLVIAAVLFHAHRTFPYRHDGTDADSDGIVQAGDDTTALDEHSNNAAKGRRERPPADLDVAAGYFAVCREYTPMGINAKPIERSTPVGSTTVAPPSPSVYQTMYRSIFDRKPVPGPIENNSMSQRPKRAGNVFYVVLRHGHLMLFDDEEQLEVRHVISLAHHDISIYSGGDVTPEGELFIKRNALCLARRPGGSDEMSPDARVSKPFYLFSENCSAKEDFYFALLKNQEQTFGFDQSAPQPKQFDVKDIISLVQKLHSSEDHVHSRWVNAMLGRIFLAVHRTRDLENFVCEKITKKISRVKKPSFLTNINIQKIDIGDAAPYFTNMKLKDLTVEGECVVEADVRYSGNCRIEVSATAKIDLGTRFKAREVNLVLAVVLKRIEGHVLFKVKPPPSNRIWLSFQTMPKMEMAIEPVVSSRQITYTVILRQIENRIKEVMAETLVQPFWDDVPFFKTEHKKWRGGIFEGDDAVRSSDHVEAPVPPTTETEETQRAEEEERILNETRPMEKTQSVPVIDQQPPPTGLFGRRIATKPTSNSSAAASSTSLDAKATAATTSRSPTIIKNNTEPVVGTETAHADLFKPSTSPPDQATNVMAALHSRAQEASPVQTPVGSPEKPGPVAAMSRRSSNSSKEADGEKKEDGETVALPGRRNTASSHGSVEAPLPQSPTGSGTGSLGRKFFMRRDSNASVSTTSTASENAQKRNTLAAVTNAAAQARQWGWNAIQRQKDTRRPGEGSSQVDLSQPMGRGQPLPPPGMPLPGPTNGKTKIAPVAVPKRKPVPSASGVAEHTPPEGAEGRDDKDKENQRPSPPPPLPPRRRRGASQDVDEPGDQNMLVVAAPDDSQPSTPLEDRDQSEHIPKPDAEAESSLSQSSSNQANTPRGDVSQSEESKSKSASDLPSLSRQASSVKRKPIPIRNPKPEPEPEPEPEPTAGDETPDSQSSAKLDSLEEGSGDDKPLVAMPVSTTPPGPDVDDDDDFSGWLDTASDGMPDEEIKDILPTSVTGTVAS